MYRGFKIKDLNSDFFFPKTKGIKDFQTFISQQNIENSQFYQSGNKLFDDYKTNVNTILSNFIIGNNGELDGSAIQQNWFPNVKCDVFISHSHQDEKLAIAFAGWLDQQFGIASFIDSCIWGYADDLLKTIDDNLCKNYGSNTYNYEKRNLSTSHVHAMLSMALMQMIDKTECLFFLNTPNSISLHDIETRTFSPWIYTEIGISQMIQKKKRTKTTKTFSRINESVSYKLNLTHLKELSVNDLNRWSNDNYNDKFAALDSLYSLFPTIR